MDLHSFTLPSGIRLVHRITTGRVAHIGLFINSGTRDEAANEHGLAHFIEHTIFKGTQKRSVFQVLNRLENVGADLNAFTTKEETCIYASFLKEYYGRTMELFNDIFFHSVYPEKEIEKEKQVVAEEIRSYRDNPSEQIFDDFEDMLFSGHALGNNILGTERSLKKISRKDIFGFIRDTYRCDRVILVSSGNIPFERIRKMAMKYFSEIPERGNSRERTPFYSYNPETRILNKKNYQVHCILGNTAYTYSDERRIPLALLNNLLGGPIMNSRLSLALRERNGLTYHNESNYTPYSDSGVLSVYFATDLAHYDQALTIVHKELSRLRSIRLSPVQLHTVKKQLIGQIALGQESNLSVMLAIGKSFLVQGCYEPVEDIIRKIELITPEMLAEIANEIFNRGALSMLTFKLKR
ncbi:MAG: pitrilysin family protein [bacterium]